MLANKLLSIVIPTYNRAELLDYCLGVQIPLARIHNIQIFIFDNASLDETEIVVKKRIKEYPLIRYFCSEENIGPDGNFERALKYPKTEYVWLLGDSYLLPDNGIDYLLNLISADAKMYDVFLFNVGNEVKDVPSKDYVNQNLLLSELCWLMTCMSCLVYSSKLIANADFPRYRNTNFIQTGIIFEYIANSKFNIHWESNISVKRWSNFNKIEKESWQSNVLEVWFRNRANFIFSLPPSYNLDIKLKSIMEADIRSKISIKKLFLYRSKDIINYKTYKKYKYLLPITVEYSSFIVLFVSIIPKIIPRVLIKIKKVFFGV